MGTAFTAESTARTEVLRRDIRYRNQKKAIEVPTGKLHEVRSET